MDSSAANFAVAGFPIRRDSNVTLPVTPLPENPKTLLSPFISATYDFKSTPRTLHPIPPLHQLCLLLSRNPATTLAFVPYGKLSKEHSL